MFPNLIFEKWLTSLEVKPAFRCATIRDKNPMSGHVKRRQLFMPNLPMRILHRDLIQALRRLPADYKYSTACRPGCSARLGLERHRGNRYFYLADIHSAYDQVDGQSLARIICDCAGVGEPEATFNFLQRFCLHPDGRGVLTGAPASPDLFNLYAVVLLDAPLAELCRRYDLTYTRYLDDLVFSSKKDRIGDKKRRAIRQVITEADLPISHHKCQVVDLRSQPVEINGYVLNRHGSVTLSGRFMRKMRGLLHLAGRHRVPLTHLSGVMGTMTSVQLPGERRFLSPSERRLISRWHELRSFLCEV